MRKILCTIFLCLLIAIPINADASIKKAKGELKTKLWVEDDAFEVSKELTVKEEFITDKLTEDIKINNEDEEIEVKKVFIENADGKKEIRAYEKENDGYKISKSKDKYTLTIQFPKEINVQKVYIEYFFKSITEYDENFNYNYIQRKVPNKFMDVSLENQKVEIGKNIVGCWIKGSYSNFYDGGEEKEISIDSLRNDDDIILSFAEGCNFLKDKKSSGVLAGNGIHSSTKHNNYIKLFNNEKHSEISVIFYSLIGIIIALAVLGIVFRPCWYILGIMAMPIIYIISLIKHRGNHKDIVYEASNSGYKEDSVIENEEDLKKITKEYEDAINKPFVMPKYINPAYLGILFNTIEENIVFTILCELIRKDVVEIRDDNDYIDKNKNGLYRKYILGLTENCVDLEEFEKDFIEKLRVIDEINLINLEDIQKLVGKGYFKSVVDAANESFNNYLRAGFSKDSTLDEVLKNRNIELDKWQIIREQMKKLRVKDVKKLTINEMEYLHVFSTGLALRDNYFSVFKVFTPAELRMSKYFEQIQKEFDNGQTVVKYLEETFLR